MPEGYWRGPIAFIVFAVFFVGIFGLLLWDSSALLTEQRVRYEESARSYAEDATQRIERECTPNLDAAAIRGCIREIVESTENHKRSESDLDAQEQMARFTRIMGWTGLIGLFIGLGSVYLIWATLRETQKMAEDTRNIGQAQIRAYVHCQKVTIKVTEVRADFDDFTVTAKIDNMGQSPAYKVHNRIDFSLVDRARKQAFTASITPPIERAVLGANGGNHIMVHVALEKGSLPLIRSEQLAIRIVVWTDYEDVFGTTVADSVTYFCSGSLLDKGTCVLEMVRFPKAQLSKDQQ